MPVLKLSRRTVYDVFPFVFSCMWPHTLQHILVLAH